MQHTGLDTPVQFVKGVGGVRAAQLAKLGISTVEDLLYFFPRAYEDWQTVVPIISAPMDTPVCIRAVVSFPVQTFRTAKNVLISKTMATDGEGIVHLTFFNNKYIGSTLKEGEEYLFRGKLQPDPEGGVMMTSPRLCPANGNAVPHAVYPQTAGLTSKVISRAVRAALDGFRDFLPEPLSAETLQKYRLPGIAEAVELIHFPQRQEDIAYARRRLIYEELLVLQLGLGLSRETPDLFGACVLQRDYADEFFDLLPFTPTGAQKRSTGECVRDMRSGRPMRRLLQGDVGSGKTAVAAALIYTAAKNGYQSALMAPTEVLAAQHYETFCRFFEKTGVRVALLTGSTRAAERRQILASLADGSTALVIGTHALISEQVGFYNLGLAVTDEQHRFGVGQRAALRNKGKTPHVLVMSATPIPRTLSLIIYGDLDISILDEKPAGRQPVETFAVDDGYRARIFAFLKKQLDAGRQGFIVCPLVEETADEADEQPAGPPLVSAEALYGELCADTFRDYKVGLLHGRLRPKEKDAVMAAFSAGELQLLVCTVVIEVGIDVPNANVMVVENAERFGLSQLHQLRGRVGRGKEKAYCILVSDAKGETARMRLDVMRRTDDGFLIAEEDLKLRGPGDFFGARQSGLPDLRIADLMTDSKILYAARDDAKRLLREDPALSAPEHRRLRVAAARLFADLS